MSYLEVMGMTYFDYNCELNALELIWAETNKSIGKDRYAERAGIGDL